MVKCNRKINGIECGFEGDWYEDNFGKWKIGTKLDVNVYRPHDCEDVVASKFNNNIPKEFCKCNSESYQLVCSSCGKSKQRCCLCRKIPLEGELHCHRI